jgi:hypothetical protein
MLLLVKVIIIMASNAQSSFLQDILEPSRQELKTVSLNALQEFDQLLQTVGKTGRSDPNDVTGIRNASILSDHHSNTGTAIDALIRSAKAMSAMDMTIKQTLQSMERVELSTNQIIQSTRNIRKEWPSQLNSYHEKFKNLF